MNHWKLPTVAGQGSAGGVGDERRPNSNHYSICNSAYFLRWTLYLLRFTPSGTQSTAHLQLSVPQLEKKSWQKDTEQEAQEGACVVF
jgi:hypothetical protein